MRHLWRLACQSCLLQRLSSLVEKRFGWYWQGKSSTRVPNIVIIAVARFSIEADRRDASLSLLTHATRFTGLCPPCRMLVYREGFCWEVRL